MSRITSLLSSVLLAGAGLAACGPGTVYTQGTVSAGGSYATTGAYYDSYGAEPPLVEIQPNVWVVESYNEPVFYSDNFYWRFDSGLWYRSPYYNRGWVTVTVYNTPTHIRSIDRPYAYVRYRGGVGARWRQGPRGNVVVRDHRDDNNMGYQQRQQQQRENIRENQERQQNQRENIRENQERQQNQRENIRENQEQRQRQQEQIRDNQERIRLQQERIRQNRLQQQQQQENNPDPRPRGPQGEVRPDPRPRGPQADEAKAQRQREAAERQKARQDEQERKKAERDKNRKNNGQ